MTLQKSIEELRNSLARDFILDELPEYPRSVTNHLAVILDAALNGTLIPADAVFQVREGYSVMAVQDIECELPKPVPLTEALEIRSADDVRREAIRECLDLFESRPDAVKVIRALTKGGDDE